MCAPSFSHIPYNTISFVHKEHTKAFLGKTNVLLGCSVPWLKMIEVKYILHSVRFWLPASYWSASARMLQPIRHTSQIGQAGQTGKETQQLCDADVLLLPVHRDVCWGCLLTCAHTITLWCRLTYLCLLLCNVEQLCCSLIGRIIGTLSYGHRLYVQNWSLLKN